MKIKTLEEVKRKKNKLKDEIKRDFKIQTTIIIVLIILALIICFKSMKLAIDYKALEEEKQALEQVVETQKSIISDLEENCNDLYLEIKNLKGENKNGR